MPTHSDKTILLATDQQHSVLNALDVNRPHPVAYTPYGHRPLENILLSRLGFNGQMPDLVTGHYHLGNGYRQFNPVLMRFNSPDSWSPFGEGGLNAYGYCAGDPVNRADPTGHMFKLPIILGLIDDLSGTNRAAVSSSRKAMLPISEASEFSPKPISHGAQSVAAKPLINASESGVPQRSLAVPTLDDASFRRALDHAIEGAQSIPTLDAGSVPGPPLLPTRGPRPVRTRNTNTLGGNNDFLKLKVTEARSTINNQTTQIRKS